MAAGPALPLSGGCLCGKVRFEVQAAPLLSMACHCRGCQRLTASAFSLSVVFPKDAFRLVQGELVIGALHKPDGHYRYCDWCKCWLLTEPPPEFGIVNIRTMAFDEPGGREPFAEFWTDEKVSWAATPAKHSFPSLPPMERFGSLCEEFAQVNGAAAT